MPKRLKTSQQYDEELQKITDKLKKALSSQRAFFADASHELRTPLTIIKGNLDLIYLEEKKQSIDGHLLELLDNINTEMKRMSYLLSDITFLNAADSEEILSRDHTNFKPIALGNLIVEVLREFENQALEKKITLEANIQPCEVLGDLDKLKKCIEQLVSNSLRYNNPGGTVTVGVKPIKKFAVLQIEDTGIGISEEDLPYIFDRFYRTHPGRGKSVGSGLGLAIAKQVIAWHHGKISVTSKVEKGTCFTIKLPLVPKPKPVEVKQIPAS